MNPFHEDASTFASASSTASVGASDNRVDVHALAHELARDANVEDGRVWGPRGERDDGGRFDGGAEGGASSYGDRAQHENVEERDVGDARARKPREVSADERINATATAVIKAGVERALGRSVQRKLGRYGV